MSRSAVTDLYLHRPLSSLRAGQDGWLFQVSTPDKDDDTDRSSLWLLDKRGRTRQLTSSSQSAHGAIWSSCGSKIAFLRAQEGTSQVHVLDLDGGEASVMSSWDDGVVSIEHWDGDAGQMLVIAHHGTRPDQNPFVVDHLPYKLDGIGFKGDQRSYLHQLEESSGELTPVVDRGGDVVEAKWAPDRSSIAFVQRRDGQQRHLMDLWLKREGAQPKQLTDDLASLSGLTWSPSGKYIAFSGSAVEGTSMSWLTVVELETGQRQDIKLEVAIPGPIHWADGEKELLFLEAHRGTHRIARVALAEAAHAQAIVHPDRLQVLDMAACGDDIAYIAAGPAKGPEVWRYRQTTQETRCLTSFNAWRDDRPKVKAELRTFTVPDGAGQHEKIEGWLLRPNGPGPFPLLWDMHGGPHSLVTFEHETHVHWPVLLERGWAVLALNAVGTNSYGEDFAQRLCGHWGELDLPQWRAATEALRAEGIVNSDLAVFGHSYGGFLAAWALTQKVPLVCGVVSAGVINLESHTGTSDTGYYVGPYAMAGEPDQAPDRYRRQSPLSHVQAIDAPVLLLQGEADQRCPLGQAEELFARLVRIGHAEARMVIFPGGTHHVSSTGRPSHRAAFYGHLADWVSERSRSDKPHTAYDVSEAEGVKSKDQTQSQQSPKTIREAAK